MNLKVLFMILVYYGIMGLFIGLFAFDIQPDSLTTDVTLDNFNTTVSSDDVDTGVSFFGDGLDIGRFLVVLFTGIGLGSDFPSWFVVSFIAWQSIVSLVTAGFIISSVWDG